MEDRCTEKRWHLRNCCRFMAVPRTSQCIRARRARVRGPARSRSLLEFCQRSSRGPQKWPNPSDEHCRPARSRLADPQSRRRTADKSRIAFTADKSRIAFDAKLTISRRAGMYANPIRSGLARRGDCRRRLRMPSADGLTLREGASPETIKRITTHGRCKAEERRVKFLV